MAESGQADMPTTPQNAICGTVTGNSCARKCALEADFNRNKRKTLRRGNVHPQSMGSQIYLAGPGQRQNRPCAARGVGGVDAPVQGPGVSEASMPLCRVHYETCTGVSTTLCTTAAQLALRMALRINSENEAARGPKRERAPNNLRANVFLPVFRGFQDNH